MSRNTLGLLQETQTAMGWNRKQGGSKRAPKRNLVAKYAREFNHSSTFEDRKRKSKRGYRKHKGNLKEY